MVRYKATCVSIVLYFIIPLVYGQHAKTNSTGKADVSTSNDSTQIFQLYSKGEQFEQSFPDSALWYYNKAREIAQSTHYQKGIAAYASYAIVVLNNRGQFREALSLTQDALEIYLAFGSKKDQAIAYLNCGSEWQYLSDLQTAADFYFKALKLSEELNEKRLQRIATNNLSSIFTSLNDFKKGKEYAEYSLQLALQLQDDYAIASSMYNIANTSLLLKEYKAALNRFSEIESIGKRTDDYIVLLDGLLGQGDAYRSIFDYIKAISYYEKVIALAKEKSAQEYELYAHIGLVESYRGKKALSKAIESLMSGILLAKQLETTNELKDLYFKASVVYEEQQQFKTSLDYRKLFELLDDSLGNEKSRQHIQLMEARFDFEKKEQEINELKQLTLIKDLSLRQSYLLAGILLFALLTSIIVMILIRKANQQNKKMLAKENQLHKSKIAELENERQLMASEAVMKGQDEERIRLAKDLHDGLGGLLSGVKFSLSTMKSTVILDAESALTFERSLDMLDHSIAELRRVAHNMMPEVLVKYGLKEALKSYCENMQRSQHFTINYQAIEINDRFDSKVEIFIYRIVQELITNAAKHAEATSILVQLAKQNHELIITVEDNGKGFEKETLERNSGIGLSNIRSRVEYLKGKLDVQSSSSFGTSVHITVPL